MPVSGPLVVWFRRAYRRTSSNGAVKHPAGSRQIMDTWLARHFVAYEELNRTPNIVVDASGNAATVITLSHWPKR